MGNGSFARALLVWPARNWGDYLTGHYKAPEQSHSPSLVNLGAWGGYHSREVETFGAPIIDQEANRELFEEQVEIVFKAFDNESFSHKGKHYAIPADVPYRGYQLKELTLVPAPGQPAGRMLAADRQRQHARDRVHAAPRHQGPRRRRRCDDGGGADPGLPARCELEGP
ncbi:MAG TPA: hypothetical protein VNW89_04570 [Stellaceae bacterium]|nr:hypothetical protein [Stellaceae bacterium]